MIDFESSAAERGYPPQAGASGTELESPSAAPRRQPGRPVGRQTYTYWPADRTPENDAYMHSGDCDSCDEAAADIAPRAAPAGAAASAPPAPPAPPAAHADAGLRPTTYRAADTAVVVGWLAVALVLTDLGRFPAEVEELVGIRIAVTDLLLVPVYAVIWRAISTLAGLYDPLRTGSRRRERTRVLLAAAMASAAGLALLTIGDSEALQLGAAGLLWGGTSLGLLGVRGVAHAVAASRPTPVRNLLVVGSGPRAAVISERLRADSETRCRVVGYVDSEPGPASEWCEGRLIDPADLQTAVVALEVDEVVVALPVKSHYAEIERVVDLCERLGVPVTLPADPVRSSRATFQIRPTPSLLAVTLADVHDRKRLIAKRVIDVAGALTAIVISAPLMLLAAVAIKLTSPGPVLFKQKRYGRNRRVFAMYKFRSMVENAETLQSSLEHLNEAAGPLFKIQHDPRVTFVGRILRRTSIDELPQLFNVLRGEMSLVGPRPLSLRDMSRLSEATLLRRFSVAAGMTGLWQVRGRSELSYEDLVRLDLQYIDEWSLFLDLKILALTVPAVLSRTGAD